MASEKNSEKANLIVNELLIENETEKVKDVTPRILFLSEEQLPQNPEIERISSKELFKRIRHLYFSDEPDMAISKKLKINKSTFANFKNRPYSSKESREKLIKFLEKNHYDIPFTPCYIELLKTNPKKNTPIKFSEGKFIQIDDSSWDKQGEVLSGILNKHFSGEIIPERVGKLGIPIYTYNYFRRNESAFATTCTALIDYLAKNKEANKTDLKLLGDLQNEAESLARKRKLPAEKTVKKLKISNEKFDVSVGRVPGTLFYRSSKEESLSALEVLATVATTLEKIIPPQMF